MIDLGEGVQYDCTLDFNKQDNKVISRIFLLTSKEPDNEVYEDIDTKNDIKRVISKTYEFDKFTIYLIYEYWNEVTHRAWGAVKNVDVKIIIK